MWVYNARHCVNERWRVRPRLLHIKTELLIKGVHVYNAFWVTFSGMERTGCPNVFTPWGVFNVVTYKMPLSKSNSLMFDGDGVVFSQPKITTWVFFFIRDSLPYLHSFPFQQINMAGNISLSYKYHYIHNSFVIYIINKMPYRISKISITMWAYSKKCGEEGESQWEKKSL